MLGKSRLYYAVCGSWAKLGLGLSSIKRANHDQISPWEWAKLGLGHPWLVAGKMAKVKVRALVAGSGQIEIRFRPGECAKLGVGLSRLISPWGAGW